MSEAEGRYEGDYRRAAGAVFRRLREERGWSLRAFGEHTQTSHTTLFAVEQGRATPGIEVLGRVAEAMEIDLPALLLLIVDELSPAPGSLADLMARINTLSAAQRAELDTYIQFVRFRDESGQPES